MRTIVCRDPVRWSQYIAELTASSGGCRGAPSAVDFAVLDFELGDVVARKTTGSGIGPFSFVAPIPDQPINIHPESVAFALNK